MIKRSADYKSVVLEKMRGGEGSVTITHVWEQEELSDKNPNRLFAKLTLKPNCSIGIHVHENEDEVFYVMKGEAEANDNGEIVILKEGDTILTGNGGKHSIKCISDTPLELLAVITCY